MSDKLVIVRRCQFVFKVSFSVLDMAFDLHKGKPCQVHNLKVRLFFEEKILHIVVVHRSVQWWHVPFLSATLLLQGPDAGIRHIPHPAPVLRRTKPYYIFCSGVAWGNDSAKHDKARLFEELDIMLWYIIHQLLEQFCIVESSCLCFSDISYTHHRQDDSICWKVWWSLPHFSLSDKSAEVRRRYGSSMLPTIGGANVQICCVWV